MSSSAITNITGTHPDVAVLFMQAMQYVNDSVKIVHCQNGRFTFHYLNESAFGIFQHLGFQPETFIGKSPTESFPTPFAQKLIQEYLLVIEKKQEMTFEVALPDARIDMRYFQRRLIPLPDKDGNISFIVSMMHDVTEEKYHNRNQQRLALMLENAPAIFLFADKHRIFYYSPVAFQILEIDNSQDTTLSPRLFFEEPNFVETVITPSLRAFDMWKGDCQMRTLGGKVFPASVIVTVQRYEHSSEEEYIYICLDRTEQQQLQQRLFESERIAQIILNNIQQYAFIRLDTVGSIMSWNQGAQRLFEYDSDTAIGRHIGMLEPVSRETEGVGVATGTLIGQVTDLQELVFENRRISSSGRMFYAKNILSSLYDHQGRHLGYSLIVQDITEIRQFTTELRRKRRETEIFIETSPDIILRFSPQFTCLFINQMGETITNLSRTSVLGTPLAIIVELNPDLDIIHTLIERVVASGNQYELRGTLQTLSNGRLIFAFKALPEFDEKNRLESVMIIGSNITTEINAQETLLKTLAEAKETEDFKLRFRKVISHELRTPLAGVKMSSDIIERYIDSLSHEELLYHTREINSAVREIESLLDNLLLTMKIETQTLKLSPNRCDIVELCQQKIAMLRKDLLASRHVVFSASHEQLYYSIDTFLFQTALRNILANAADYSAPTSSIHVWVGIIYNQLCISVHDAGIGIAEDDIPNVIEPFFRGKNAENVPGIGMGLFVARHCVEMHEGTLEIQSVLGKETTVTISLPLMED